MGIATTTLAATTKQLSDQNSVGTQLGASITDLISFYAATPVRQQTSSWQSSILSSVTASSYGVSTAATTVFGYSSAQQANALLTAVSQIQTVLVNLGLMKGS